MRSVSRSSLRPPLGRTTQMAPLGSIHFLTSLSLRRSANVLAPMKTRSHFDRGLPITTSVVRSRTCLMKPASSRSTTATYEPGFTPSLSSSGRVDGSSLLRFASIAPAPNRSENDHPDQPTGVRAGDGDDPDDGAGYLRGLQTSTTCRSVTASSTVPE